MHFRILWRNTSWRWQLINHDGGVLADCQQEYATKDEALLCVAEIKSEASQLKVWDEESGDWL